MTVSTINSVAEFVTNGAAKTFPFYFKFLEDKDLVVTYINPDGVSTVLAMDTQYTVSGAGNDKGGSITTTAALLGPGQLIVSRDMEAYQKTSLRNQGKFLAETHEDVFDRLTMLVQQGLAIFKRALVRPFGRDYFYAEGRRIADVANPKSAQDSATKSYADSVAAGVISYTDAQMLRTVRSANGETLTQLPPAASRANKVMGFDAAGNPIGVLPASGSATELAIDLADMVDPYRGASLVGYVSIWPGAKGLPLSKKYLGLCLCPEEFGAKGDGVTDDSAAFYAMSQAKGNIRLLPDSNYLLTKEFAVKGRVLDMNGSKITFYLTGATQRAIRLMDGSEIRNGFVEVVTTHDVDVYGDALIPIIVGQYYEGVGYRNVGIFNMVVLNNRTGGMGVFITGDTSNVVVDRLFCPETDKGAAGIYAEWGGIVGVKTYHPHNMRWSNIVVGKRSVVIGGPDGVAIGTSGCYNVTIDGFTVEMGATSNMAPIGVKVGGGAGFAFAADPNIREMVEPNIVFQNGQIINDGLRPNMWLYGRSSVGAKSWSAGGVVFRNINSRGTSANNGGLVEYVRGGKFIDCTVHKNLQGYAFGPDVQDTEIIGGTVYECWQHGVNIGNSSVPPRGVKVDGLKAYRNGQRSLVEMNTYYSGVFLNNSYDAVVTNVEGGSLEGVETQYSTINAGGLSSGRVINASVYDNHTKALRFLRPTDTPAAYVWGANATDYSPALPDGRFTNNTSDSSVTAQRYAGMRPCIMYHEDAPISSSASTKVKRSIGPGLPFGGAWNKGDTVVFTPGAVTGPGGKVGTICTTAGEAGVTAVFKNYGAIDA